MKRLIITGLTGLALLAACGGKTRDPVVGPKSPFAVECEQHGLDPEETSGYELYAVKLGLPSNATPDEILERKYGFNPSELPQEELDQRIKNLGFKTVRDLYTNLLH